MAVLLQHKNPAGPPAADGQLASCQGATGSGASPATTAEAPLPAQQLPAPPLAAAAAAAAGAAAASDPACLTQPEVLTIIPKGKNGADILYCF